MDNTNYCLYIDDALTNKNLICIDLGILLDVDVVESILNEIFENNHYSNKHNLIIRYGFRP